MHDIRNIEWIGDGPTGFVRLLDQTRLPGAVVYEDCRDVESIWRAIRRLAVRGAPAIGIAAAYGCVIAQQRGEFVSGADYLATSRPTAVNLFWAIDRMKRVDPRAPDTLLAEAKAIHEEDRAMCRAIGEHTLALLERLVPRVEHRPTTLLTHCNAGALATGGIGTATAGIYLAQERGAPVRVFADETRPLLQGSRLTAFELAGAGVDVTLICDGMAGQVMREGRIDLVITGADRIAANGDAANKIGTYGLAVLARHHGVPFIIAAPSSTFDFSLPDGSGIPIELRDPAEITGGFGAPTAPPGVAAYSPAFDVTPRELIRAIVTERGVIEPVNERTVGAVLNHAASSR